MSIQLKRGSSAERKNSSVVLADGQPFYEKDTNQLYIGDGSTAIKDLQSLILAVYPIGSIYMSVNPANPSTLFGGTWIAWGSGKVPVGVNANDSDFATAEKTGGEKNHTLTKDEMPVHAHTAYIRFRGLYVSRLDSTTPTDTGGTYVGGGKATDPGDSSFLDFGSYINGTETAGKGKPHNNLQPYITCYMWKRTA